MGNPFVIIGIAVLFCFWAILIAYPSAFIFGIIAILIGLVMLWFYNRSNG